MNSTGGINTKLLWEGDKGDHSNYGKIIKWISENVAVRNMNWLHDGVQIMSHVEARFLNLLWKRNKWDQWHIKVR